MQSRKLGETQQTTFKTLHCKTLPTHVLNANSICTYKAFFIEHGKLKDEIRVVRHVVIKYYLEDDTVEIHDPKPLYGRATGALYLKRMSIPEITPEVLVVGGIATFFGRRYSIYHCNQAARVSR